YIEGATLRSYIKKNEVSLHQRLNLITTLLEAFSFIQQKDIIHGDIHTSNFMVDKHENLRIIDFGMSNHSKLQDDELLKKGGAYYYIPPERVSKEPFKILNKKDTNFHAENYQLGVIIFYILYGDTPHSGLTWKILSDNILNEEIVYQQKCSSDELIPANVMEVMKKALSKNPKQRYSTANEFYQTWLNKVINHSQE
ncbi:MAG: hypothetical protein RL662_1258, partial [Bacteroidota bacterium]